MQLNDTENEEQLWETWLHKDQENTFADFKKKYYRKNNSHKNKALNEEEEKRIIENAMKFIKPTNEGGEIE